jgi:hypothetical protein
MEGIMEEKVNVTPITEEVKVETPSQEEHGNQQKVKSSEVLREIAKEFSVNLFEENGLAMLKEKWGKTVQERDTYKTQADELTKKEELFAIKEQEYQVKLSALGLGFSSEQLDEVLALAKVNTKEGQTIDDGLKAVKEKYGSVFVANQNIGLQLNDIPGVKPDVPRTEQEKYLRDNPRVQYYNQKNKK